jgi:hypothetical protein
MVPASGESSDTRSPDPAVASNDPYYFFANPFALASQPRLKQSVFGFAGRTNSGNLGSTFAFGSGAPEAIFFDNYIIGGAYQRDFIQFNSGVLIGADSLAPKLASRIDSAIIRFVVTGWSIQIASRIQRSYGVGFPFDTKASPCSMRFEFHRVLCLG